MKRVYVKPDVKVIVLKDCICGDTWGPGAMSNPEMGEDPSPSRKSAKMIEYESDGYERSRWDTDAYSRYSEGDIRNLKSW